MPDQAMIETQADLGTDEPAKARRWCMEIEAAEKECDDWRKAARKIVKRYRDERGEAAKSASRFNILWSNVETLRPALYARQPKPVVDRRHKDADPVARAASQVLERGLVFAADAYDLDAVIRAAVEDELLVGRGVGKVRLDQRFGEETQDVVGMDPMTGDPILSEPYRPVVYEAVVCEHVAWDDYLEGPARTWTEVPWIAYRARLTRDQLVARFGAERGKDITLDYDARREGAYEDASGPENEVFRKATLWEIWDKRDRKVRWLAPSWKAGLLDERDDPYGLIEFFPSPASLDGVTTNDTRIPVPEYTLYQDQAIELDELSARITLLSEALALKGVYAGSATEVKQLLGAGAKRENALIPVENWAAFADRGGLKGVIEWLPLEMVLTVLAGLHEQRDRVVQVIYQVTGIADIVRGASNAQETATAQRIKGNFASLRLNNRQAAVQRFARGVLRIEAELIAEHFDATTLATMAGLPDIPPEVLTLLRDDKTRGFRVDIETDSTILPDAEAEKHARTEFLTAVGGFMQQTAAFVAAGLLPVEVWREMILFGARGFNAGRDFEAVLEGIGQQPIQQPGQQQEQQAQGPSDAELQLKAAAIQSTERVAGAKLASAEKIAGAELASAEKIAAAKLRIDLMKQRAANVEAAKAKKMDVDVKRAALARRPAGGNA